MQTIEQVVKDLKTDKGTKEPIKLTGLPSGFKDIDKQTLGFQNGQLTILAGRPGMGLTTLALNIARNITKQTDKRIAIFTLDQTAKHLTNNILKAELETSPVHFDQVDEKLTKAPIYIDDTQCISVFEIMERAAALKHDQDIDIIIVDYLQLITGFEPNSTKTEKRNFEKIVRLLQILAKSINIPILLLSTLTHQMEMKSGYKMPTLNNLYAYGAIEKYADLVLFLYCWEYYGFQEDEFGADLTNQSLLIIAKNRNGQLGEAKLRHDFEIAKFTDNE